MHHARRAVEVGLALIMLENGLLVLSCTRMTNNAADFYHASLNKHTSVSKRTPCYSSEWGRFVASVCKHVQGYRSVAPVYTTCFWIVAIVCKGEYLA